MIKRLQAVEYSLYSCRRLQHVLLAKAILIVQQLHFVEDSQVG